MATSPPSRVAQLPGFDTAPDVYETAPQTSTSSPTTTTPTSSSTSSSEAANPSDTSDSSSDGEGAGVVSRRRLYPERARSRFGQEARSVHVRGADLSDRVDGRRRGFRRSGQGEEEEESLPQRLARLKREVEECRALVEKEGGGNGAKEQEREDVEVLGRLLAGVEVPRFRSKAGGPVGDGDEFYDATEDSGEVGEEGEQLQQQQSSAVKPLEKVSDFETRLAAIEAALGSLDETAMSATPLIPTLALLDQQFATLNSATSLAALESVGSRISALKQSAQELSDLQQRPAAEEEVHHEGGGDAPAAILSADDVKHLHELYALLPTLHSLAPTVPALTTRLRSLRTLHTTAASASADLDAIEQRQTQMDRELRMWKEGLEKVEQAVKDADVANGRNGGFVQSWVKDLEKRMEELGR